MKNFKTLLIIGAATASFALSPALSAQVTGVKDKVVDSVKDEAVKRVKGAAKDKALETVKGTGYGSGAVEGAKKVEGAVEKAKAYGSGNKDGAVEKAKAYGSVNKDGAVEKAKAYGSGNKAAAPAASVPAIACPAGTTAQPNGTCMITGNYKGS